MALVVERTTHEKWPHDLVFGVHRPTTGPIHLVVAPNGHAKPPMNHLQIVMSIASTQC